MQNNYSLLCFMHVVVVLFFCVCYYIELVYERLLLYMSFACKYSCVLSWDNVRHFICMQVVVYN